MSDEIPIAGDRDGVVVQSPCGAGVIAPASLPLTADAVKWQAASDFLATLDLKDGPVWSLARQTLLTHLWFQGVSTREIGLALGLTKNAIVGQAHRMELPGRPSPIPNRMTGPRAPAAPKAPKAPKRALPPMPVEPPPPPPRTAGCAPPLQPPPPAPAVRALPPLPTEAPPPTRTAGCAPPLRLVVPAPVETVWRARAHAPCCWPLGEPGTKSFRFCEADGVPGRPYCPKHMRKAYTPVTRREPDARDRDNRDRRCT